MRPGRTQWCALPSPIPTVCDMQKRPKPPTPENLRLVSCATCGNDLLGESAEAWLKGLSFRTRKKFPPMCCRHYTRPYCADCYFTATRADRVEEGTASNSHGQPGIRRGRVPTECTSQSQDNAIRVMEDML
jgi:hypothetical protein